MMAVMGIGVGICVGLFVWAFIGRLPGDGLMPCAGSCSAAISAACHAAGDWGSGVAARQELGPDDGVLAAEGRAVMWGVVREPGPGDDDAGICGFTDRPVGGVVEGKKYA